MVKKTRVSIDLEGDLAIAFLEEFGKRVARGGSSSKAELGRMLIAESLQARGYDMQIPDTQWGGYKSRAEVEDDEYPTPNVDKDPEFAATA